MARPVVNVQREVHEKVIEDTTYYCSSYERDLAAPGKAVRLYRTREEAEEADRKWRDVASKGERRYAPPGEIEKGLKGLRHVQSPSVLKPLTGEAEQKPKPPLPPPRGGTTGPRTETKSPTSPTTDPRVTRPLPVPPPRTGGARQTSPSPGGDLAALVIDLYRLDVSALKSQWAPRVRPPFEGWFRARLGDNEVDYFKWLLKKGEDKKEPSQEYVGAERALTPELLRGLDRAVYAEALDRFALVTNKVTVDGILQSYNMYFTDTEAFWYNVFQWSSIKSPQGPADLAALEFSGWPYARDLRRPEGVTMRVYLNTVAEHTKTVAEDLAKRLDVSECVAIKYAPGTAAAFRRDAIVIYVQGTVQNIVSAIGSYQKEYPKRFVDEAVRLTGPTGLTGVGIAEHPRGDKSYSDLTSQAVRKALARAESEVDLPRVLREELKAAGLDPDHPGRLLG